MNLVKEPIKDIRNLIPQKHPFVMVDTLLEFSNEHIISSLTVSEENIFVNENYFLEPGLVEHMAQTVALHTGYDYFLKGEKAPTGYIGSIKKVVINSLPKLGEVIQTEVRIIQEFMGVTMVKIKVMNSDNKEIASGEMKTVIAK